MLFSERQLQEKCQEHNIDIYTTFFNGHLYQNIEEPVHLFILLRGKNKLREI